MGPAVATEEAVAEEAEVVTAVPMAATSWTLNMPGSDVGSRVGEGVGSGDG